MNPTFRKPLRLLFVNTVPADVFRGGEKSMMATAIELQERGHTVLIGGRTDSAWIELCGRNGLCTYSTRVRGDFNPEVLMFFYRLIRSQRLDGVCLSPHRAVRVCGWPAKLAGVPAIVSRMGLALPMEKDKFLYRFDHRHIVDRVLINSHALKAAICRMPWLSEDRVTVVHNGTEIPEPASQAEKRALRDELGIPHDAPLLVAVGWLTAQKGFAYLLDALATVRQSIPSVRLLLLGRGELRGSLQEHANELGLGDRVLFLGHRSDVPRLLPAADLYVLSSLWEGCSNAVLEAMAARLPIIATTVGGVPELVEDGVSGILVRPRSAADLSAAICRVLGDPERLDSLAESAHRHVRDRFTMDRMVTAIENLFYEILMERQRAPAPGGHRQLLAVPARATRSAVPLSGQEER